VTVRFLQAIASSLARTRPLPLSAGSSYRRLGTCPSSTDWLKSSCQTPRLFRPFGDCMHAHRRVAPKNWEARHCRSESGQSNNRRQISLVSRSPPGHVLSTNKPLLSSRTIQIRCSDLKATPVVPGPGIREITLICALGRQHISSLICVSAARLAGSLERTSERGSSSTVGR
jgi:hypothetical protein